MKIKIDKKIFSIYLIVIICAIIIRLIMLGVSNFEFRYKTLKNIRDNLNSLEKSKNYYISIDNKNIQKQGNVTITMFYDKEKSKYYNYYWYKDFVYYLPSDSYKNYGNSVLVKLNSKPKANKEFGFDEYKNLSDFDILKMSFNIFSYKIYKEVLYDSTYEPNKDFFKMRDYYIEYIIVKNKNKEIVCFDKKTYLPQYVISADGLKSCDFQLLDSKKEFILPNLEIIDEAEYEGEID